MVVLALKNRPVAASVAAGEFVPCRVSAIWHLHRRFSAKESGDTLGGDPRLADPADFVGSFQ